MTELLKKNRPYHCSIAGVCHGRDCCDCVNSADLGDCDMSNILPFKPNECQDKKTFNPASYSELPLKCIGCGKEDPNDMMAAVFCCPDCADKPEVKELFKRLQYET